MDMDMDIDNERDAIHHDAIRKSRSYTILVFVSSSLLLLFGEYSAEYRKKVTYVLINRN